MKKIFTLLAAMLLVPWVGWGQNVWDGSAKTDWYDTNPEALEFTINTAEDLAGLAKLVNESPHINFAGKTVKLGADIFLNEEVLNENRELNDGSYKEWKPIGYVNSIAFQGTFDGQGHTISGLYSVVEDIDNEDIDLCGLFGYVGDEDEEPAIIKNVSIIDSYIKGGTKDYVSGLCSVGQNVSISKCYFAGAITAQNPLVVGAISVNVYNKNQIIESCYNQGNINVVITKMFDAIGTPKINISGIGGTMQTHTVYNCYNTGNITVTINNVDNQYGVISIGGIGSSGNIASCYNEGDITVSGADNNCIIGIGGISGMSSNTSAEMKYCYNIGEINSTVTSTSTAGATIAVGAGSIIGINSFNLTKNYYLKTENGEEKGVGGNIISGEEEIKDDIDQIEGIEDFSTGEIAWKMREPITIELLSIMGNPNGKTIEVTGYGQQLTADGEAIDKTPVLLAFSENEGKEVYKLTLSAEENSGITIDEDESTIYRNAIESNLLSETKYNSITKETGEDIVWKDEAEKVVVSGNKYTPTEDIELTATINKVYNIKTIVTPEGAGDITVKESAAAGETISFTVMANEGYEFISVEGATFEEGEEAGSYTFTMPAEDITITATFKATETGGDDDDEGEGGIGTKRYQLFLADQDFYLNDEYDAEGLVLYSLHDKRYTKAGSSFTIWFEKHGEVNEGARVFISNRANGEYKEVKLDEVSGYYQIRNVQSNIYVKLYTEEGFPVANESIEATDARAYAQANKIVVITPEPTEVQIISMAGAVVATAQVAGQQEFANLAEGVYIVRMGKEIIKLQVRN